MRANEADLADVLAELFPDGLTTREERREHGELISIDRHFWRRGRNGANRDALADEAVVLRGQGLTFKQIGTKLGISTSTASLYVRLADPTVHHQPQIERRGGRTPGVGCRLEDEQLRDLHAIHAEHELSIAALARRIWQRLGYASWESAANSIASGWRRLGLAQHPRAGRCSAINQRGKPCARLALLDSDLCFVHDPRNRETTEQHSAKMRTLSPKCNPALSA